MCENGGTIVSVPRMPDLASIRNPRRDAGGLWQLELLLYSTCEAQRLCPNRGTSALPSSYFYTEAAGRKQVPLVWPRYETP